MSQQTRSRPSTRRRSRIGAAALLLLAAVAAGCHDQPQGLTAPDAPARYTGTYNPAVDPAVRATPSVVSPGKTYRFWYKVTNTSPDVRSYWVWGYEGSGTLQIVGRTADFSLQPGERRWVYVDMAVQTPSANTQDVDLYFDVHDMQGDALGYTRHIQPVRVSKLLPTVGFVAADYREVIHGQTHQAVYPGEIKTLRVHLRNPLGAQHTICTNWLEDEGAAGQTTRPQPSSRCVLVPAYGHTELNFAYRVPPTATAGALDKQSLQVYSLADPGSVVYGYLRTTTSASPTVVASPDRPVAPAKFHAFTFYSANIGQSNGIPIQVLSAGFGLDRRQDRLYVGWQGCPPIQSTQAQAVDTARVTKGRLYIYLDEPGQGTSGCTTVTPQQYAAAYRDFVAAIRNEDPTARFSPAGFEQDNPHRPGPHFTAYADSFVAAYRGLTGEDPPVAEWRFHAYVDVAAPLPPVSSDPDYLAKWDALVTQARDWSVQHGAPMVLAFGYPGTDETDANWYDKVRPGMEHMVGFISPDPWIVSAGWWSYDVEGAGNFDLAAGSGYPKSLTRVGCRYRQLIGGAGC